MGFKMQMYLVDFCYKVVGQIKNNLPVCVNIAARMSWKYGAVLVRG